MKSFLHRTLRQLVARSMALGVIGISLIGVGLGASPALALTQEQVGEKLSGVPVFVIGNDSGLILVNTAQANEAAQQPSLYVFMTEQDAETFLAQANEANPEFAPDAEVGITNLEILYQESRSNSEQPIQLVYVPEADEANQAVELNTGYRGGVPLFFARFEDGSLAPVQQENGETIFPMFFSRADLEALLAELGERNPEARAAISVGVLPLELMLQEMQTSDDELLNQILLLPDSETINDIQSQSAPE
ncbi:MAG: Tic22 family protein [Phormidesmis sp.]